MAGFGLIFVALFIQSISSQMIQLQQFQQPTCQSQILADSSILQQFPQQNIGGEYSIDLCKNLATAVQNMVLNKLSQSAYNKPIFNQIAGPLLSDIALKTQNQCPVCGNANVVQNLVSTPCGQVQALGNQLASYQSLVNPVQTVNNQVQALFNPLQNNQVQTLVNPIQTLGNQIQTFVNPMQTIGNQLQGISYGNLNQAQGCPCNGQNLRLSTQNVLNQNQAANAAQQKYSEAIAILESLKNGNNCACGQRGGFNLF